MKISLKDVLKLVEQTKEIKSYADAEKALAETIMKVHTERLATIMKELESIPMAVYAAADKAHEYGIEKGIEGSDNRFFKLAKELSIVMDAHFTEFHKEIFGDDDEDENDDVQTQSPSDKEDEDYNVFHVHPTAVFKNKTLTTIIEDIIPVADDDPKKVQVKYTTFKEGNKLSVTTSLEKFGEYLSEYDFEQVA